MKKRMMMLVMVGASLVLANTAHAQRFETQQLYQRIAKIEKDVNLLQRQAAIGGGSASTVSATTGNLGQISTDVARLEEEIRGLRGQIEQASYEAEQNRKQLEQLQKDIDFRFQQLENRAAATSSAPSLPTAEEPALNANNAKGDLAEELTNVARSQPEGALGIPSQEAPMSARDLYNHAFKLLNQTNYAGAEKAFIQFTKQFPQDPLIGNAWYWLGEAYYVQRDYVKSADSFRQGYEKLPDGPKAGDNLLKLAMSLSALERGKEACIVLRQVDQKFSANSEALRNKARQEISRLGCK